MFCIGICDDDEGLCGELEKMLYDYGKEQLYPEYESVAQLSREKEIPFTEIYRYIVLANKDKE